MEIRELTVGPIGTRCYILWKEGHQGCAVIDPGGEPERIMRAADGRPVEAILLTHGHFDHIGGVSGLMKEGTRLIIHPLDEKMLHDPELNAGLALMGRNITAPPATDLVREGDRFEAAGLTVEVLHTPGHTQGSVCYQIEGELFTGDTLFEHGWGRTDLPGGDETAMFASLRRLMRLAKTMPVHPGH